MWNPRNLYRRSPALLTLAGTVKQGLTRLHGAGVRGRRIRAYLAETDAPRLHVGAGPNDLPGWLNADLRPLHPHHIYLDAARPLPFADDTFSSVYAEHMIQHLSFQHCVAFFRECRRVLRPGGRLRIASADLHALAHLVLAIERTPAQERYIRWVVDRYGPVPGAYLPGFVLNNAFYNWRSRFLYDAQTLRLALEQAGFPTPTRHAVGESPEPAHRDIEQHGRLVGEDLNRLETMVFEAACPPPLRADAAPAPREMPFESGS